MSFWICKKYLLLANYMHLSQKGETILWRLNHIYYRFPNSVSQAHLVPTDEIKVYYRCQPEGDYLNSVVQAHTDFIMSTIKAPLLPFPVPKTASVIISENTQVWWTEEVSQTAFCFCDGLTHIWDFIDAFQHILFLFTEAKKLRFGVDHSKGILCSSPSKRTGLHLRKPEGQRQQQRER